jgi:GntR family transcriptional regulator/MocR family aminotransferase
VPIVPIASVGGQEAALFLDRGQWLARLLGVDKMARLKSVPILLAPPWGIAVSDMVPRLPLPPETGPDSIDLSPGVPDLAAFPRTAWLRAERQVLRDANTADLGYGDPRGHARLRAELSVWLARQRGVRADPGQIIVVAGVAQALALLAQTLRAQGHTALAVEDPGSLGAREQAAHWGLRPTPVPVDEQGLQVAALEQTQVPVALLTPAHQFPTGVVLSPSRRRALLEWARTGGLIIEDDYDAEHRYDRAPVRALQPSAPDRIAHTGSTSKTLAPGMRLGWLVPPRQLYPDLVDARHANDLGSPALPQLVLAELLAGGGYERHLRLVRNRQRRRRDAMLAALAEYLPGARIEGAAAGLHLLITLPGLPVETADTDLATAARHAGIHVHPLSWHRLRPGIPGLVLGYAAHPPDRLRSAIQRLAAALPKTIGRHAD